MHYGLKGWVFPLLSISLQLFDAVVSCNLVAYLVGRDLGGGAFLPVVCHVRQLYFVSRGEGDRPPSRRAVFFPPSLIACPCRRHGLQERHGFVVGFVVGFVWVCIGGLKLGCYKPSGGGGSHLALKGA